MTEKEEGYLIADGFDEAIIGISDYNSEQIVVYSADKCIEILMKRDGMTDEQAMEFFYYNVQGAYVGPKTPIFVFTKYDKEDLLDGR